MKVTARSLLKQCHGHVHHGELMHACDGWLDIISISYEFVSLLYGLESMLSYTSWALYRQGGYQNTLQSLFQIHKKWINSKTEKMHAR